MPWVIQARPSGTNGATAAVPAPGQLTNITDFTCTQGTALPDPLSGIPFIPVTITIVTPPSGLAADAYLSIFAYTSNNPSSGTQIKTGLNYGEPWNSNKPITTAITVWVQQTSSSQTIYFFPVIQSQSASKVIPDSSFINRSLTIAAGAGPLTDPGQIGSSSDFTATPTAFFEHDGQQWCKIAIHIVNIPVGLPAGCYPTLYLYDGTNPTTANLVYGLNGPPWNGDFFPKVDFEAYVRQAVTAQTVYAFLFINSKYVEIPVTAVGTYRTVIIPALGVAPAPSSYTVGVVTATNGGTPSGRFVASMVPSPGTIFAPTAGANISEYLVERVPTNSSFVPVAGQPYVPIFHVSDPAWTTGVIADYATWWPLPGNVEYYIFRCTPVFLDGTLNVAGALSVNVTVPANTGLNLGGVDAATLGPGLALLSGQVVVPANAIANSMLQAGSVDTAKLAALAVTATELANSAVTATKIANLAVGTAAIANLAVGTAQIAALAVTDAKINDLSATKITAGTLIAGVIYSGTVNASQINAGTLNAFTITSATITSPNITSASGSKSIGLNAGVLTSTNGTGQVITLDDGQVFSRTGSLSFGFDSAGFTQTNSSGVEKVASAISGGNGLIRINGTKVLGAQGAHVTHTSVTIPSSGSNTADSLTGDAYNIVVELKAAVDTLLARLEAHGIIA